MRPVVFIFCWFFWQLRILCCFHVTDPSQHVLVKDGAAKGLQETFSLPGRGDLLDSAAKDEEKEKEEESRGGLLALPFLNREDLKSSWKPPLSTKGRYIIDADGNRFRMKAGNWHGASGTYLGRGDINDRHNHHSGEQAFQTPLCLDRTPIEEIVQSFLDLGINTVRLPFSNEMIHSTDSPPDSALVRANPQLRGLTPLEIYDACILALTRRGIAVILNNHTIKNKWCCGPDSNARWNSAQTDEQWQEDWIFLVKRYKDNPRVVAAELYNEVRRDLLQDPVWGGQGGKTDWFLASQIAGSRIQREANADILIIIEGINYVGLPTPYTKHWRPELQPVRQLSHTLPIPDKLVYSAHFYSYTGPNATGGPQAGTHDAFYRDLSMEELEATVNALAFFVATPLTEEQQHYTNPVLISEFGSGGRNDYLAKDRIWWTRFISLLIKYDIDFAVWPLVGWQERAKGDLWALNSWDASGNLLSITNPGDWRFASYKELIEAKGKTGHVESVPRYRLLHSRLDSPMATHMSNKLQNDPDLKQLQLQQMQSEQEGSTRQQILSCPDGLRIGGFATHHHHHDQHQSFSVLCTDAFFGRDTWHLKRDKAFEMVSEATNVYTPRRALGYRRWLCNPGQHMVGFHWEDDDKKGSRSSSSKIICVQSSLEASATRETHTSRRIVRLQSSSRPLSPSLFTTITTTTTTTSTSTESADKGASCRDDELLVGLLTSSTRQKTFEPIAIFCQSRTSTSTSHLATMQNDDGNMTTSPPLYRSSFLRLLCQLFKPFLWTLASKIPLVSEGSYVYHYLFASASHRQ